MRKILLAGVGFLLGLIVLGFVSWPIEQPLGFLLERLEDKTEWQASVAQAQWRPWAHLLLREIRLQTPQGGRLHLEKVRMIPNLSSLWTGRLTLLLDLEGLRIDPASWGIHQPLAQELLSVGPVVSEGSAIVRLGMGRFALKRLILRGPLLRLQGQGWLTRDRKTNLDLDGMLARTILEGMNVLRSGTSTPSAWEPFQIRLNGILTNPQFTFASRFFSFSWGPAERAS